MDAFVWEPSLVKVNAISSATEAACLILSVDETVRNPQSEQVCQRCIFADLIIDMLSQANPGPKAPPGTAQRALRGRGRGMARR
jgi:T-complex protein 1 subunit eta